VIRTTQAMGEVVLLVAMVVAMVVVMEAVGKQFANYSYFQLIEPEIFVGVYLLEKRCMYVISSFLIFGLVDYFMEPKLSGVKKRLPCAQESASASVIQS
jgi:hypothetical protein